MSDFLDEARALLGAANVLTGDVDSYATDWRGQFHGKARAVLRPGDIAQAAACVKLCATHRIAVVPQGGNTGMCGGATPDESGSQVVIAMSRMNAVRAIDPLNNTITVEAGCVLQTIQDLAAEHDRLFPLSLGAEGSCQIGGNISTNAGGRQVLRYGNMRELVLGVEVVLADGRVLDLMRALRKDNTGYDLKHLFIGSEGTLGLVTAAVLKLYPAPRAGSVVFASLSSVQHALQLLGLLRGRLGDRFTAFELMSLESIALVRKYLPDTPALSATEHPWHVMMQANDGGEQAALDEALQGAMEEAIEAGIVNDVLVATSGAQAKQLWAIRENISEAQQQDGQNIKHDIAVPVSSIPAFIDEVLPLLHAAYEGVRPIAACGTA